MFDDLNDQRGLDDAEFEALTIELGLESEGDADARAEQAAYQAACYRYETAWERHPNRYDEPCGSPVPCGCVVCTGQFGAHMRDTHADIAAHYGPAYAAEVRALHNRALHGLSVHPPVGGCELPPNHGGRCMTDPRNV